MPSRERKDDNEPLEPSTLPRIRALPSKEKAPMHIEEEEREPIEEATPEIPPQQPFDPMLGYYKMLYDPDKGAQDLMTAMDIQQMAIQIKEEDPQFYDLMRSQGKSFKEIIEAFERYQSLQ